MIPQKLVIGNMGTDEKILKELKHMSFIIRLILCFLIGYFLVAPLIHIVF